MPLPTKTDRNKELLEKRLSDPIKWSFSKLAEHYGITKQTAHEIFGKEMERQGISTGKSE